MRVVDEPAVNPTHTRIIWTDSAGRERSALLAKNLNGSMTEYRYPLPGGGTRTAGTTSANDNAGFGYHVAHRRQITEGIPGVNDSYPGYPAENLQFQTVFEGRHQAIFRYKTTRKFYARTNASEPNKRHDVPVIIEWMFSTGRDHPLYSVTFDMSDVPINAVEYDSRTPYGELNFSGSATISGVEWGDRYKFTTTNDPWTWDSPWTWNVPNRVPYVALWTNNPDATMGLVQTQSLDHHDAGAWNNWNNNTDVAASCWNRTSDTAPVCRQSATTRMPWQNYWSYQALSWSSGNPNTPNVSTTNTRLTWGMSYGALGQANYSTHNNALNIVNASGWPRQSYSLALILGTRSSNPVAAEVARTEALESVELSTTVGSVALNGLAGNVPLNKQTNVSDNLMTYTPPGYDPVRSSLTFIADDDQRLTATIKNTATIAQPLIVVRHMRGVPVSIKLNGVELAVDTGYFASYRADTNEAWLTLAGSLAPGEHALELYAMPQFRGANFTGMEYYTFRSDIINDFNNVGSGPEAGSTYPVFDFRTIDYLKSKGFTTIRLPCTWESLQPRLYDPIPSTANANYRTYFRNYKRIVDYATNIAGMQVIIDPHGLNPARNDMAGARYRDYLIGSEKVPNEAFADFWGKMATIFKGNALVSYGLVNEPNNQSTMTWFRAAQAAINAIRATGSTQRIFVPGNDYSTANWEANNYDKPDPGEERRSNAYGWLNARGENQPLFDPLNNIVIEVHKYVDSTGSGEGSNITSRTAARAGLTNVVNWARARNLKVYLGEIGMWAGYSGGGFTAPEAWMDFVNYFNSNASTFIGYTWWACGHPDGWWPDTPTGGHFQICPNNEFTAEPINMQMLQKDF
jgi:hypothetical protein